MQLSTTTKNFIKQVLFFPFGLLNVLARLYSKFLSLIKSDLESHWYDIQNETINKQTKVIKHTNKFEQPIEIKISSPNKICRFRADSFSVKEPETLLWIDTFGGDGAFFDIGANIGLYSLYYAASKAGNVYAFEPSFFNLGLLAKNINLNNFQHKIIVISNPLNESDKIADFNLSSDEEGAALSTFGVDYGYDGMPLDKVMSYKTAGFSLDELLKLKFIEEPPSMIKIDVDGIEHLILKGGINTIKHPKCRTILIESNNDFVEKADGINQILFESGFTPLTDFYERAQSKTFNQVWVKNI